MTGSVLKVPPRFLRGALKSHQDKYVESGRALLEHLAERMGLPDLGGSDLLDVGCGSRFTQAVMEYDIPIRSYTGIDIDRELIAFLSANVRDPRFRYHHMDFRNEMYNPCGVTLSPDMELPAGKSRFDIICLYSVFTHLEPPDYHNLLKVLRPCIRPGGRLLFTLYIDEITPTGMGLVDGITRKLGVEWRPGPGFRDAGPKPLKWALYSKSYALELIEHTGWAVVALHPPGEHIQHHFICRPA